MLLAFYGLCNTFSFSSNMQILLYFCQKKMLLSFSIFEAFMLLCFAVSWPISIYRSLKTKFVLGKSPTFMVIIIIGYVFGIIHKLVHNLDFVTFLWVLNMLLVTMDLSLYFYYAPKNRKSEMQHKKG